MSTTGAVTLVDCGCRAEAYQDGSGIELYYCDLHDAADDLLAALKELLETLRAEAPGTPLNNHKFDALGIKANNAIAKAEGR